MLDARADSNKTEIMLARVEKLARAKARTATRLNKAATFVSGIVAISATAIGVTKPEGWQIYIACLAIALILALAYSVFEAKDVTDHYFDLRDNGGKERLLCAQLVDIITTPLSRRLPRAFGWIKEDREVQIEERAKSQGPFR